MMFQAEILALGNELLIGRTVNSNMTYIAQQLTQSGFIVDRSTTIRDDLSTGVNVIKEILSRQPSVMIITGGLGPTHDDIHLQILSEALRRPLEKNSEALELIKEKYDQLNPSREKMAYFPTGSIPLRNDVGSAPGVLTKIGPTSIFSVPGVPSEMKSIMINEIVPILEKQYPANTSLNEYGLEMYGARESEIAQLIDEIQETYPDVMFKSHPRFDGKKYWLALHVYSFIVAPDRVYQALESWVNLISQNFNVETTNIEPVFSIDFHPDGLNDNQ